MGAVEKERKEAFLSLLKSSPTVQPPCPHVTDGCGGCLLQQYPYEDQARAKELYLESVYKRPMRLHAATDPLGYRSRMDYVCAFGKMGLRKRGRYAQVIDVKDCLLLPDFARAAYREAREFLLASGLTPYNYIRHEGFLRYLVVRASHATRQVMLIATTVLPKTPDDEHRVHDVLEGLLTLTQKHGVVSVHWTISDAMTDLSVGEEYWHCGEEGIIDEIAESRFLITPQTFFQGNTLMASVLFDRSMRFVRGDVLDLYCGVGVLAILAAQEDDVGSVVGVEMNARSISMANDNMRRNGVTADKCAFVCADAAAYLASEVGKRHFNTIICDPNRPGLGPTGCALLIAYAPERIIYISCNPLSHIEDLARLCTAYDIIELEGYDLFPQTPHIEVLSVLAKRPPVPAQSASVE
ncbi:TPA: class I SAM-dependent RNA methyltransferase [Candidatus Woesearchaeota archaeon]|nr:class I SAM-dependent RNA methyltransferase [Candidatus Woesearchaeota archaeon]